MNYSKEIQCHDGAILSVRQLKDGRIVTCGTEGFIKVWDLDFREVSRFKNHTGIVNCLCVLKDGGFCSGGADCIVNVFH